MISLNVKITRTGKSFRLETKPSEEIELNTDMIESATYEIFSWMSSNTVKQIEFNIESRNEFIEVKTVKQLSAPPIPKELAAQYVKAICFGNKELFVSKERAPKSITNLEETVMHCLSRHNAMEDVDWEKLVEGLYYCALNIYNPLNALELNETELINTIIDEYTPSINLPKKALRLIVMSSYHLTLKNKNTLSDIESNALKACIMVALTQAYTVLEHKDAKSSYGIKNRDLLKVLQTFEDVFKAKLTSDCGDYEKISSPINLFENLHMTLTQKSDHDMNQTIH